MGYVYQEYPKTFHRIADGKHQTRVFASAEAVEPGWVELDALGPLPEAPKPPAPRKPSEIESENAVLKDSVKLLEDEAKAKDGEIAALRAQVAACEAMLDEMGDEAPAPEAPAEPPSPKKKKRTKA